MRVAFDHQIFFQQSFGGISRYFVSLASEFVSTGNAVGVFAPLHRNHYLRQLPREVVHGLRLGWYPSRSTTVLKAFNHFLVKHRLQLWKPDIVHETYYASRSVAPRQCPTVVTVYDMIHEIFSDEFAAHDPTTVLKRAAITHADHVICISESTRQDVIRLFGVSETKISVVHLGFNRLGPVSAPKDSGEGGQRPYLLYVGNRAGYKNFSGFLRAVAASVRLQSDIDVLAFGGGAFSSTELALINDLGYAPGQVRQVGGSDEYLGQLYKQARAFVYPSLYEGFGLPPLEAMAQDCPVVSSNTSSMPEVIGQAAEFFDPADVGDMATAIERVVYDDKRVAALVGMGHERLDHFSWRRCSEETLALYRHVRGE